MIEAKGSNAGIGAGSRVLERSDWLSLLMILAYVVVSRVMVIPAKVMGGDGPAYANALRLDGTYAVPPPGNIGYVLLAKGLSLVIGDVVTLYAVVGTLVSCVGAGFVYALARLGMTRRVSALTTMCVMTSVQVWYHGVIMQSYIVWLAALASVGYFSARLVLERTEPSWRTVVLGSVVTGAWTIVRPDLVAFAGPLWGMGLLLGRARVGMWVVSAVICAGFCCVWLFATAHVIGSMERYLELVRTKHEWHETYSAGSRGLVEGLGRNVVKYATFMVWTAHLAIPIAIVAMVSAVRRWRATWRGVLLAGAWAGPSLYFSWIIFTGNAGLVLPALGLMYLVVGWWLSAGAVVGTGSERRAMVVLAALATVNVVQFLCTPIPAPTDQRRVLLTHMFFGYSATGLWRGYTYELPDFGVDKSLKGTVKQMLHPEPPPRLPAELEARNP